MPDLKDQVRELGTVIEGQRADAAAKWQNLQTLKKSAADEGVDFTKNQEAFDKIDAAGKEYDTARDAMMQTDVKRTRLLEILAMDGTGDSKEFEPPMFQQPQKPEPLAGKSYGTKWVESDIYKEAARKVSVVGNALGQTEGVEVIDRKDIKTVLSVSIGGTPPLGGVPEAQRLGLIVPTPLAQLNVLDLIPMGATDSDVVEWINEDTWTSAAAETAEGTAAGEAAEAFSVVSANVKEITHFLPVTRRSFNDVAWVESWVNMRLMDGVRRRLQTQALTGDGTGENFTGVYNTAGIGNIARTTLALSLIDSLHSAMTTIRVAVEGEPDFIGMHPNDWETIRLTRDDAGGAGTGTYLYGPPAMAGAQTLWGLPIVLSTAFTSGSPIVGRTADWGIWVREGVAVSASDSHSDYFVKRQVAILAAMRAAFGVTQAAGFCTSTPT